MACFLHEGAVGGGPRAGARAGLLAGLGVLLLSAGANAAAQDTATPPEPAAPPPTAEDSTETQPATAQTSGLGFRVIVHAGTRVTRLPAKTVTNMFLKKSKRWENGDLVLPVDLGPRHPVRKIFTRAVHDRSVNAVVGYWQRVIFAGRGEPPESKASEQEVLAFVAANPGAIGYVSDEIELDDGVRPLIVDDLKANP